MACRGWPGSPGQARCTRRSQDAGGHGSKACEASGACPWPQPLCEHPGTLQGQAHLLLKPVQVCNHMHQLGTGNGLHGLLL